MSTCHTTLACDILTAMHHIHHMKSWPFLDCLIVFRLQAASEDDLRNALALATRQWEQAEESKKKLEEEQQQKEVHTKNVLAQAREKMVAMKEAVVDREARAIDAETQQLRLQAQVTSLKEELEVEICNSRITVFVTCSG